MNRRGVVLSLVLLSAGCAESAPSGPAHPVVPAPREIVLRPADTFHVSEATPITVTPGSADARAVGEFLSALIGNTVDTRPPVREGPAQPGGIHLDLSGDVPPEGYRLDITRNGVTVQAATPAGLFYGAQTLRQLLPALVEYTAAYVHPLPLPGATVVDAPRYAWRGMMLDVSRHFLPVEDLERFVDLMALHKLNRLHLHLADDQGWRIEIPGWPRLTEHGGSTEVGGGPGGFYTLDEYAALVEYAAARHVTIVPEIDVPGHTNAALASYAELNCDGEARDLYTGTDVGFSSLCPDAEITFQFLDDVIGAIAARTPGAWFHVGGDEVRTLSEETYVHFIERVRDIVERHGKRLVGWDEVASADLAPGSVIQLWRPLWPEEGAGAMDSASVAAAEALEAGLERALAKGSQVLLSPADRIYLDMKYDERTVLGLTWAGVSDTRHAYDWQIDRVFRTVPDSAIAGVEAPLWSETLGERTDFEYMAFPRLAGVAEIGWSPAGRSWEEYRQRLGAQAPRWVALGVNFRRSPLVPWAEGPDISTP